MPEMPAEIADTLSTFPEHVQQEMQAIRDRIFALSEEDPNIGEIEEALKWGEISFLTVRPKSGTTVRLGYRPAKDKLAVFVNCQTSLIADFKEEFSDAFEYEKNRALLFTPKDQSNAHLLEEFLNRALKYHKNKS